MSNRTDAYDPSARFAGTSPSKTMGRVMRPPDKKGGPSGPPPGVGLAAAYGAGQG